MPGTRFSSTGASLGAFASLKAEGRRPATSAENPVPDRQAKRHHFAIKFKLRNPLPNCLLYETGGTVVTFAISTFLQLLKA